MKQKSLETSVAVPVLIEEDDDSNAWVDDARAFHEAVSLLHKMIEERKNR